MVSIQELEQEKQRIEKLLKIKQIFMIALAVVLLLSFVSGKLIVDAFDERLPVETVAYDRNNIQVDDQVEVEISEFFPLFKETKTYGTAELDSKYYGIVTLENGDTFLADTNVGGDGPIGHYYGRVHEYDENVQELLTNPEKYISMDLSDMEVMKQYANGVIDLDDIFRGDNYIYENRETLIPLFGDYQITLSDSAPTRSDPRQKLEYIPFGISAVTIMAYFVFNSYVKKRKEDFLITLSRLRPNVSEN